MMASGVGRILNDELVRGGSVVALRASLSLPLPSAASEQAALEAVVDEFAPIFAGVPTVDGERDGALLVVSDDAGAATAVNFWRDALAAGLGFASPAAFPWCLANAPCATIARRFSVTGPNCTWLTPFVDSRGAFDAPAAWLADQLCANSYEGTPREAWLVALHFGAQSPRVMVWHWSGTGTSAESVALGVAIRNRVAEEWSTAP
jgi:hypothetical protein